MPKLRRLNGREIIRILQQFGFEIVRIRGSHHILRRTVEFADADGQMKSEVQTVNVPVHGSQPLATGTLRQLYRDLLRYLSEEELEAEFFTD